MDELSTVYKQATENGLIIPDTSSVNDSVESAFKSIFGSEINTSAQSSIGRLIECITMFVVNSIGINAQNANQNNPTFSTGAYLDSCGALFGVERYVGESDDNYRVRLLESQSRGISFAESIRNAISKVDGVINSCVLNNDTNQEAVLPDGEHGVVVPPHSIFVSVYADEEATDEEGNKIYNDDNVAIAILNSKRVDCGYSKNTTIGTPVEYSNGVDKVYFIKPAKYETIITVAVRSGKFTGIDLVGSVRNSVYQFMSNNNMNCKVTKENLSAAIAKDIPSIIIDSIDFQFGGDTLDELLIGPNQVAAVNKESGIVISVS